MPKKARECRKVFKMGGTPDNPGFAISLPIYAAEKLGVHYGDKIRFVIENNQVMIRKVEAQNGEFSSNATEITSRA